MITRLQVRNFKSLRDIDLELGPLNVLVGPNMSGKSNILDALRFLHDVFFAPSGTGAPSYALTQRGGVSEVLWKGGDDKLIKFAIEAVDETDPRTEFKYALELVAGAGDFVTVQNESLRLRRSGKEAELIFRDTQNHRISLKNASGSDAGGMDAGTSALQYATPHWDGYRFKEWVGNWRYYHLVPPDMKEPSPTSMGQVLTWNGDNLSAWLMWLQTRYPEAFGRLNEVLRDLFPEVVQIKTIPTAEGKVHLAVEEKQLKRHTTVWQTSDGFLALTALLSLIYAPAQVTGSVISIEEPENHLHPKLFETLVALLRQVRQELADLKGAVPQLIVTTQSPYLVDQFSLDEITWIEKKNGETKAFRPADKEYLKKLVEDKDLGLGNLMYSGALGDEK